MSLLIKLKWYKTATFLHKQSIKRISQSQKLNDEGHDKDGKVTGFMSYSVLFIASFFISLCLYFFVS
ncbi:hypothetical protein [Psychromonas sp. SA13A]|uniref:hypothetical protein n=1 Tax=Psychromonas sp. SA13A TaxID=2686346 RepID=UPI00140DD484|nr:hypothetical protein [Psychromonas sp. SA13A]